MRPLSLLIPSVSILLMAVAGLTAGPAGSHARAESSAVIATATTIGVDVDATGNTATSLGPIDTCRSVSVNDTFTVDVFIDNVSNLALFNASFSYNGSVVNVTGNQVVGLFMGSGVLMIDNSDSSFPDSDGSFFLGALDFAGSHSGSGVFARVTLEAVDTGVSPSSLVGTALAESSTFADIAFTGPRNGEIRVGQPCPSDDTDGDSVPDISDQCPDTPAGQQADHSGCSAAQLDSEDDGVSEDSGQCPGTPASQQVDQSGCFAAPLGAIEAPTDTGAVGPSSFPSSGTGDNESGAGPPVTTALVTAGVTLLVLATAILRIQLRHWEQPQ